MPQCVSCHPLFLTQQGSPNLFTPSSRLGKCPGTGQAPGSAIRRERVCQGQAMGATGSPSSGACRTVLSKHFIDVLPPVLCPSYPGWEQVHGLHFLRGKPLNPVSGPRGRGPFPSVTSSGKEGFTSTWPGPHLLPQIMYNNLSQLPEKNTFL